MADNTNDVTIVDGRTPEERERDFLPGASKHWMMPFYDVFSRFAGVGRLHRRTVELAEIAPGQHVLDVGCGTGNLALTALRAVPDAVLTGLDPDGSSLERAGRKAKRRRLPITLVQGYADRLPRDDGSVDRVISALALHHVDDTERAAFAREVRRVLRPGGTVTIADFSGEGHHQHAMAIEANGIVTLLQDAGFADAREVDHRDHRFGRIGFIQATR